MVFIKNSVSNLQEKQGKNDCFVPALAILTGVLASFFLVKSGFFTDFIVSEPVAILLAASSCVLIFTAFSGLNLFGFLLVVIYNFVLGGLLMLVALLSNDCSAVIRFFVFFAVLFFSLLISTDSYHFSKSLLRHFGSDAKLRRRLLKHSALTLGVILIIFSALFFLFKFNPELFI